jgi:hypothetical protein
MDDHFWSHLRFFPYTHDGAKHVYYSGKTQTTDGKILWYPVHCPAWFPGSILLYFRRHHVLGKKVSGKTGLDGKIEAAKIKLALS